MRRHNRACTARRAYRCGRNRRRRQSHAQRQAACHTQRGVRSKRMFFALAQAHALHGCLFLAGVRGQQRKGRVQCLHFLRRRQGVRWGLARCGERGCDIARRNAHRLGRWGACRPRRRFRRRRTRGEALGHVLFGQRLGFRRRPDQILEIKPQRLGRRMRSQVRDDLLRYSRMVWLVWPRTEPKQRTQRLI